MNLEEALEILRSGIKGIAEWNRRRETGEGIPSLRGADLHYLVLKQANLEVVNLSRANLMKADLEGCNLRGANLSRANLQAANLRWAQLTGVNLRGALLKNAILHQSLIGHAVLGDIDLSSVKGLESVHHKFPSTLGIDSIILSKGKIPHDFLRGVGMPDALIHALPELVVKLSSHYYYSCFISYSHADSLFTQRLHDALQNRGIRCWLDDEDAKVGDDILELVNNAIHLQDRVLLCCSRASLRSKWVERELNITLDKERQYDRKILLPLNLDGFLFDEYEGKFASELRSRVAADFVGWESDLDRFDDQIKRVYKALRQN